MSNKTYVLACHALADNFGMFIDENVGARFISVNSASSRCSHHGRGPVEETLRKVL